MSEFPESDQDFTAGILISLEPATPGDHAPVLIIYDDMSIVGLMRLLCCEDDAVSEADIDALLNSNELDPESELDDGDFILTMLDMSMSDLALVHLPDIKPIPPHHLWNQHPSRPGKAQRRSGYTAPKRADKKPRK